MAVTSRGQRGHEGPPGFARFARGYSSPESASGLDGTLKIASRLRGLAATVDDLDADAYLLNTPGGTIDLRTLVLRPHDPADLLTKITRGSWDPANPARSRLWDEFLDEVLPDPDVRGFLQRVEGMALLGAAPEAVFPILTGTGANGKSVEMGAVAHALGDFAATAEDGLFEVQRSSNPHGPTPALAKLRGVRRLGSSELAEGARINAPLMKRLTGGDRITARELHSHPFEFAPAFTPMMLTNFLPKLPANDPAVWRRVVVVPFDIVIPETHRDPHQPSRLEHHADAILAWALEGWREYSARGLMKPAAVVAATSDYAEGQDDVRKFVDAWCVELAGGDPRSTKTTTLHDAYRRWATDDGRWVRGGHIAHVLGKTKFAQRLDALGVGSVKTRGGMVHPLLLNEAAE